MTRETRIGLLVGLSFIVMFGLVLGELTGGAQPMPEPQDALGKVREDWAAPITLQATDPQEHIPVVQPERSARQDGSSVESRLLRPGRNAGRVSSTLQRRQPAAQSARRRVAISGARRYYEELSLDQLQKRFAPGASNKRTARSNRSKKPSGRIYVVRSGDNLTKIARRTLKDDSHAAVRKLYEANRDRLKNPDRLSVGMKLRIPS